MVDDHGKELCTDTREITGNQSERLEGPEHSVYAARRLTPTECAALQGFPKDWAADIPHTDSQEYKMWGNGIALPCLLPMMKAMADELDFSKHMNPPEET